jgi:hypothetical protein
MVKDSKNSITMLFYNKNSIIITGTTAVSANRQLSPEENGNSCLQGFIGMRIIKNAVSAPKPVQTPMPPILIGGGGEKRTLKMVAEYADYCNLTLGPKLQHKLDVLRTHCKNVGRNYEDVGKSLFCGWLSIFVTDSEEELETHIKERADQNNVS